VNKVALKTEISVRISIWLVLRRNPAAASAGAQTILLLYNSNYTPIGKIHLIIYTCAADTEFLETY
jgi:hypothetical protein